LTEPTGHACDLSGSRIKSKTMSKSMSKIEELWTVHCFSCSA
jgi:hypothetical protein